MTALSNLVSKLDCKNPEILTYFPEDYVKLLLKNVSDKQLQIVKDLIDNYIKGQLVSNVLNYKLYSYKTLEGISAEILIQPENTSVIIQYILVLTEKGCIFKRLR